ncbi:LysR family transcriptional regulator [Labrys miyagiensis]|uniref:LysR family transcriptional regulator n=1 Tax=Labrys miyagiensis TaxID=346912 RepID=A0ABQ6CQ40_9HYPH|nr:LysR family transcriptional regulator [Labrys miyagiensis]GLS21945.1 LysR family transcriptional regulator [Labrys miyagiensis]
MDRLDAIRLFLRVVERGNFAAAAREAGIGQPAVSKQIAALEAHLCAQLLRRTSRSMTLSEAGQTFYEAALRLVADYDAAASLIGRGQFSPSGLVRVSTSPVFGRLYITPRLPEFFARYPDVAVELSASERMINLVEEGIDVGIRIGNFADSSLIALRLASTPIITVAAPAYLEARGVPASPTDLERHSCVIFALRGEPRAWEFKTAAGPLIHHPQGNFRTGDAEQVRAAVLAGLGLAQVPAWLFAPEIASGAVRVVLRDLEPGSFAISAVHTAGRRLPTRARVFVDFLANALRREKNLAFQ